MLVVSDYFMMGRVLVWLSLITNGCHFYCLIVSLDDLDIELRLARFEELMDRRPFLLSRWVWPPMVTLWLFCCFNP